MRPRRLRVRIGQPVLSERLAGERARHLPRQVGGVGDRGLGRAGGVGRPQMSDPNRHPDADPTHLVRGRRLVGAAAVVLVSVLAVAFAIRAPYRGHADATGVRVLVDHVPGRTLEGQSAVSGTPGADVDVVVTAAGVEVGRERVPVRGGAAIGVVDVALPTGSGDAPAPIEVQLVQGDLATLLYTGSPDARPRAAPGGCRDRRATTTRAGGGGAGVRGPWPRWVRRVPLARRRACRRGSVAVGRRRPGRHAGAGARRRGVPPPVDRRPGRLRGRRVPGRPDAPDVQRAAEPGADRRARCSTCSACTPRRGRAISHDRPPRPRALSPWASRGTSPRCRRRPNRRWCGCRAARRRCRACTRRCRSTRHGRRSRCASRR